MKNLFAAAAIAALAGSASAAVTVYNTFASYDAAVGSNHTYFENFEAPGAVGDLDGNGNLDTLGNGFNANCVYSSPDDANSNYVNIANIGGDVNNEIGPMGFWNGRFNAQFRTPHIATGFTGISFAPSNTIDFFSGGAVVGSALVGGVGNVFDFYGFVSDVPFDSFSLNGTFYAIDGHYATKVPAPASLGLLGLGALAAGRRRR